MLGGRGEHPLEQLAIARLQLVLLAQRLAGGADALGERIADALELGEAGDMRDGVRDSYPGVELDPLKGLDTKTRQLVFEAADLAAQLDAREALIAPRVQRPQGFSIEQIRHRNRDRV